MIRRDQFQIGDQSVGIAITILRFFRHHPAQDLDHAIRQVGDGITWIRQFIVQMTAAESESLLQRLAEAGRGGVRMLVHELAAATDGWALPSQGRRRVQHATWGRPPQNRSAIMSPRAS